MFSFEWRDTHLIIIIFGPCFTLHRYCSYYLIILNSNLWFNLIWDLNNAYLSNESMKYRILTYLSIHHWIIPYRCYQFINYYILPFIWNTFHPVSWCITTFILLLFNNIDNDLHITNRLWMIWYMTFFYVRLNVFLKLCYLCLCIPFSIASKLH